LERHEGESLIIHACTVEGAAQTSISAVQEYDAGEEESSTFSQIKCGFTCRFVY